MKGEPKMCDGCMGCDPTSYTVEVDLYFLNIVENALETLDSQAPEHSAPGWIDMVKYYKDKLYKKYKSN